MLSAVVFVIGVWWASTALALRLVWSRRRHLRFVLVATTAVGLASLAGLGWSAGHSGLPAVYVGFASAIGLWGWHEITFLLGVVTGPQRGACPPDVRGGRRFWLAASAVIHHEVALALTVLVVVALGRGEPNQVGTKTFVVLWVMRLSAKLNVFLGVRNLAEEFLPSHLAYLRTYFRRARMNPLMPLSLAAGGGALGYAAIAAWNLEAGPARLAEATIVATILFLGLLEHVFLVLPLPDAQLFRWAIRSRMTPSDTWAERSVIAGVRELPSGVLRARTKQPSGNA